MREDSEKHTHQIRSNNLQIQHIHLMIHTERYYISVQCNTTDKTLISTQCNNTVIQIHLREEAHAKQLPQELQYNPHEVIPILSVLFYPTILRIFILKIQILYFVS
jgi:hypothetical protein